MLTNFSQKSSIILYNNKSDEVKKLLLQNTGVITVKNKQVAPFWDQEWILNNLKNKIIELNSSQILYNDRDSIITTSPILPTHWFKEHVKINELHFYKVSNIQTLTFTPVQSFSNFWNSLINKKIEAGYVRGPCSTKIHAVTLLNNTQQSVGFMASSKDLTECGGFMPPKTYLNTNILVSAGKIKYLPNNSFIAQKLGILMFFKSIKTFVRNPDNIKAVYFKKDNFSDINPHTNEWGPVSKVYTDQPILEISFDRTLETFKNKFTVNSLSNLEISELQTYLKSNLNKNSKQMQPLSLEQRIEIALRQHCSFWTSMQRATLREYCLDPSDICIYENEFDETFKIFLKNAKEN